MDITEKSQYMKTITESGFSKVENEALKEKLLHEDRNVKRFREMLGIKQDALAYELGEGWTQKKISQLEQKESIELPLLKQISDTLKIPVEAFQNFDEEQAVSIISNTFDNGSIAVSYTTNNHPIEQIMKLHEDKIALYERILKEKDEMMDRLEKLITKK